MQTQYYEKTEKGTRSKTRALGCWRKLNFNRNQTTMIIEMFLSRPSRRDKRIIIIEIISVTCERRPHWQTGPWGEILMQKIPTFKFPFGHFTWASRDMPDLGQLNFVWPKRNWKTMMWLVPASKVVWQESLQAVFFLTWQPSWIGILAREAWTGKQQPEMGGKLEMHRREPKMDSTTGLAGM